MLWRKAWLECRFRLYLCLFMTVTWWLASLAPNQRSAALPGYPAILIAGVLVPIGALILAGSGINAQTNYGMTHGHHGSMYFLLSMPVAREKLLRVRAGLGFVLLAIWVIVTVVAMGLNGKAPDGGPLVATIPNLLAGAALYYCFGVSLMSFLDEFWSGMLGMLAIGLLAGYGMAEGPSWVNVPGFMMRSSVAALDPMAWLQAAAYLVAAAALYVVAWRVVDQKEY